MDAKMWGSEITRSQMLQTTSQLEALQQVLHEPKEVDIKLVPEVHRSLSLVEEQDIASKLAFLSATTPSNLEVMAICFEEDSRGEDATIRLASNAGVSPTTTENFGKLAEILMLAASRQQVKHDNVHALFQHIIRMDLAKILSRLRSRHDQVKKSHSSAGRKTIVDHLNLFLRDMAQRMQSALSVSEINTLKDSIKHLSSLYNQLEAMPNLHTQEAAACQLVGRIVKQTYEISKSGSLNLVFQGSNFCPATKSYILEASGKIGKYYSIAYELVSMARLKLHRIFNNIRVVPIDVCKLPNLHGRIHAEIKLLFFYEANPELNRPRVICSNKSACYLCNLFFEIHGGFIMPRTHGRLYGRWLLPDWLDMPKGRQQFFRTCLMRMKKTLDGKIREATISPSRRLSNPKESVLLSSVRWPSSSAISNKSEISQATNSTIRAIPRSVEKPLYDEISNIPTPPPTPPASPVGHFHVPFLSPTESPETLLRVETTDLQKIKPSPSSLSVCSIQVDKDQLPYTQHLTSTISALYLSVEGIFLSFEFTKVISGRLLVGRDVSSNSLQNDPINIQEIPITDELKLPPFNDSNTLVFHLEDGSKRQIRIEIMLDEPA